ncbi:MFS transporter [Merismopedia glauca]|uniref:MFS transporter n=1 Tax=Merismopedia glauca CCAP 1448/3 TaxID=1296344 RepID=A0A2T1C7B8_9CYAN|nr:MFS transporter [Merismopedia glauca]PSB04160.1 MFS transporter [Merismopedia glauca CCAP 1448/3]
MLPDKPPASTRGFRALLRNTSFMMLWAGQVLSQVGDKVLLILLIELLANYPSRIFMENSTRSLLMVAFTVPAVVFGSAAGVFVDRVSTKKVLTWSNLIRGVVLLALLVPFLPKQFLSLVVITFIVSTVTQFFAPAEQAAIPLLVKPENLMTANAMFTTTMIGSMVVGFAIGEQVLNLSQAWGGEYGRELFIAGVYILATFVIQVIPFPKQPVEAKKVEIHPWIDLKDGLRYLWKNKLIRNATIQMTVMCCVVASLFILALALAGKLGLKDTQGVYLISGWGIGMVAGAGVLGHWGDRLHHKPLPLMGFIIVAFILATYTVVDKIEIALISSIFIGIGASLVLIPMQTLIQQQTPESMRGKVFGFQNNAVNIALTAPLAITGPLIDGFGLATVLLGISLICLLSGIWAWRNTGKVLQDVI